MKEKRTNQQKKKQRQKKARRNSDNVRAKGFCCAFKLAFVQLIYKM